KCVTSLSLLESWKRFVNKQADEHVTCPIRSPANVLLAHTSTRLRRTAGDIRSDCRVLRSATGSRGRRTAASAMWPTHATRVDWLGGCEHSFCNDGANLDRSAFLQQFGRRARS